ncbi:transposase [Bacillus thuringiensis]|uniref:Transposase n=1 Tax=Bacillus thuringiensis TaxID=1428 RepID=A0A9X7AZN8_BACTU|nr:DDE-type integrase/transposase/recombinase [Bacillus thuringiensis]PFT90936.1 transposase [Bacillus thuringiensis]
MKEHKVLASFSDEEREKAMKKYQIISPYLEGQMPLHKIAVHSNYSIRTMRYWLKHYRNNGLVGLLAKQRRDKGDMELDEKVRAIVKKLFLTNKNLSLATIHRKTITWCKENKIWQADHTMLDIEVINAKGLPERPWLTVVLDDYSRTIAGYYIDFGTPDTLRTALTLRQAIWRKENPEWMICGIPEIFYTDHGSDFTSKHLEQVAVDLKMELSFSRVGVPRGRGKVERFFRTINTMFLQELPGFIKNKKTIKLLTLEDLITRFHNWLLNTYHNKIHSTTKQKPSEMWNQSGFLPNMPIDLEDLDLLLLHVGKGRIVHSDGIHFLGLKYVHPNLSAFIGETVEIRYDPRDISEIRIFYKREFLYNAIATTFEGYSVSLKEIESERNKQRRKLSKELTISTQSVIEKIKQEKNSNQSKKKTIDQKSKLKRYWND